MAKNLLAGFKESCGQGVRFSNVALLGSCSLDGGKFQKLANLQSVHVNEFENYMTIIAQLWGYERKT